MLNALACCYEYWKTETALPENERIICHLWVNPIYVQKYGTGFHQSWLKGLVECGYLEPAHSARGGNRRYFKLKDVARVMAALRL